MDKEGRHFCNGWAKIFISHMVEARILFMVKPRARFLNQAPRGSLMVAPLSFFLVSPKIGMQAIDYSQFVISLFKLFAA